MDDKKSVEVKEITKFVTSDGAEFSKKEDAIKHENNLANPFYHKYVHEKKENDRLNEQVLALRGRIDSLEKELNNLRMDFLRRDPGEPFVRPQAPFPPHQPYTWCGPQAFNNHNQ